MPLSFWPLVSFVVDICDVFDGKNSRSACSGSGVGVSNTNVSTIEPFDEPNETLH